MKVNIVGFDIGSGGSRDVSIVADLLSGACHEVFFECSKERLHFGRFRPVLWRRVKRTFSDRLIGRKEYFDLNIAMQDVAPLVMYTAKLNYVIPNLELTVFSDAVISKADGALCKTRHAVPKLNPLLNDVEYIGFTSVDRYSPMEEPRDWNAFLHLAGKSPFKGTRVLLDTWLQHPEWPSLTVVQAPVTGGTTMSRTIRNTEVVAPNIRHILRRLGEDELLQLQNTHGIHIQPSDAEGFGHVIVEAMSTGALVVTTDAPPMNEFIDPTRGVMVPYSKSEPYRRDARYYADNRDIEEAVECIFAMSIGERKRRGEAARRWFLDNDVNFKQRFLKKIEEIEEQANT